jgi:hypothetical protein
VIKLEQKTLWKETTREKEHQKEEIVASKKSKTI